MVNIKLGQISNDEFLRLIKEAIKEKIPVRESFKLKNTIKKFEEQLQHFNSIKQELIETYCDKKEDGSPAINEENQYVFSDPEKNKELVQKMNELANIEIEVEPMKLSSFGETGELKYSTEDLFVLDGFFIDDTNPV